MKGKIIKMKILNKKSLKQSYQPIPEDKYAAKIRSRKLLRRDTNDSTAGDSLDSESIGASDPR